MFSSRPKNKRSRRRSRKHYSSKWIDESPTEPAPARGRKAPSSRREPEVTKLHAQIGALESFLAKHHHAEAQRLQMKRENILPPPDCSRHRRARSNMTLAARRRYLQERNRTSMRFFLLFCTACALAWWLLGAG